MNLGDLSHAGLKVFVWLVLNAPVLYEEGEVVFAILACDPAEVVDIPIESIGTCRFKSVSKQFLDFGFEHVETHSVDGVFQPCIFAAVHKSMDM